MNLRRKLIRVVNDSIIKALIVSAFINITNIMIILIN